MSERWATFDCYGTLADWVGGITGAVEPLAGDALDRLVPAYFAAELEIQAERPADRYRDVLAAALRRAAGRSAMPAGAWRPSPTATTTCSRARSPRSPSRSTSS